MKHRRMTSGRRAVSHFMNRFMNVLARIAALAAMLSGALAAGTAMAGTNIYGIRGNAVAGVNNIIQIDGNTGASTVVYTNYPGGNAATLAQCPNGLIYYAINGGTNQLFVWNPQTPAIAPATLGPGLPIGALKMACSPGGTLYYLSEAASSNLNVVSTVAGTFTGVPVTVTGTGAGGDMAFNSSGTLYLVNNANVLGTVPVGGGAVTSVGSGLGAVTGMNGASIGLAFDATDVPKALTNGAPNFYTLSGGTPPAATALATLPGSNTTGDLASINVPNPDLSISKTANIASVAASTPTAVIYTIVATNSSAYPVTGTIVDTFPATLSAVTWTCAASAGSTCGVASGSGNINTTATLAVGGAATYTINATVNATSEVLNTASVALPFAYLVDATPANNTATHTIRIRPTITKSFGVPTIAPGASTTLTIAIGNANSTAITLSAALTDTLPTSPGPMTIATAGNAGTCPGVSASAGSGSVTMASGSAIPPGGCTIVVTVTAGVTGTYVNTIAAGQLSTSAGTNPTAASASLTVSGPVFTIVKSSQVFSDPFNGTTNPKAIPGGIVAYTIQVTNTGSVSPDNNATMITDAVPANTSLYVGNLGVPAGPVAFVNSSSGLTYTYTSLSSTTDDVAFSNIDCTTFTYTPVPDGAGFDSAVRCIRVNPKGIFATSGGAPFPSFQLQFRVRVN